MRLTPVLILALSACSGAPEPVLLPALAARDDKVPVVLVPGVTGVALRHRESGRLVWGNGWALLRPHDGGYRVALPITRKTERRLPRPEASVTGAGVVSRVMV